MLVIPPARWSALILRPICWIHYSDVIMSTMASQITSVSIVYPIVCSGEDHRKHQSSASLVFVWGIHRGPVNSPHKGPVTRKIFPFDDVIMRISNAFVHKMILKKTSLKVYSSYQWVNKEPFQYKMPSPRYRNPTMKIRWSHDRHIFIFANLYVWK